MLLAGVIYTPAQTRSFEVGRFSQLVNDITAYISPVKDLNGEACALVKVSAPADFAFSTPLGIVERKNMEGEIYLYLPKGTKRLTIKHPRWGVLRDYGFPEPLESRVTYELAITLPQENASASQRLIPVPLRNVRASLLKIKPVNRYDIPDISYRPIRNPVPMQAFAGVRVAMMSHSPRPMEGVRFGLMRRHGVYVSALSDFNFLPSTAGQCDAGGMLPDGRIPYYTGNVKAGRWMVTAGAIHRLSYDWCLFEGIGYGRHDVAWQTLSDGWMRCTGKSVRGVVAEVGAMYRIGRFWISLSALTLRAKEWGGAVGVAYRF